MNRHVIIAFKKDSSYKRDLGEVVGISENLKAAKKLALEATQGKTAKYSYCTIHNCKQPRSKVGNKAVKSRVTTIKDVKKTEAAEAAKAKEPKAKKK